MLSKRTSWLVITANLFIIMTVLIGTVVVPTGAIVAVIMPPGTSPVRTVAAVAQAGGALIAPGRFGWIVIARSERADFGSRLRKAGALLTLNHAALSGCFAGR